MELKLKGHSGCKIEIVREGRKLYLYKRTYDRNYMPRLIAQAQKQKLARSQESGHIRVPEILDIQVTDDCVSVKMEYIYSSNFIEHFENSGFEQIDYLTRTLTNYVQQEISLSPLITLSDNVLKSKLEDIMRKVNANPLLSSDKESFRILDRTADIFSLSGHIELPVGVCHGDLTFSNLLFNGRNYYLIDFLDSFIESPLMDIVKIRQDTKHHWSQLMYSEPFDSIRLGMVLDKIDSGIDAFFEAYDWYRDYYKPFQIVNLLRILQYARKESIAVYLKKEINELLSDSSHSGL